MEIQQAIKNNAEDLQTFVREMKLWEKDMKRKEKLLLESPEPEQSQVIPPVRNKKLSKMEHNDVSSGENLFKQQKREESLFEKERGNALAKQGKWVEAIHHYTEAINSYSWDATFYTNRALCYLKLQKWREAETDCTTALQIDTTYDKAFFRRALALKELGQLKEARDDLLEILKVVPDDKDATNEIVKLEKLMPELKSNKDEVKMDLPKDKKQLALMEKEKGNALVKSKDWKLAIECYSEACRLNPEEPSSYLNRALCFLKTHEPRKTIVDCCRVLELDTQNVKAYYRRALAHEKLANLSKAHDDLLTAFNLDPSNEDVGKMLNRIEKRLGLHSGVDKEDGNRTQASEESAVIPDSKLNQIESPKRITGERFLKLGGQLVKPERKAAHTLSKKPLRKINIVDKVEESKAVLESALNDLCVVRQSTSSNSVDDRLNSPIICKANVISNSNAIPNKNANADSNDLPVPKSAIQFTSTWSKLGSDPQLQFSFLKKIGGNNFASIFKDALESYTFSEILNSLATYGIEHEESLYEILHGFSKVNRFVALLLFANEDDNRNIKSLLQYCEEIEKIPKEQMDELRSRYYC